jgi:hypothetical protein
MYRTEAQNQCEATAFPSTRRAMHPIPYDSPKIRAARSRTSLVGNYSRIRRSGSFRKPLVSQGQVEPSSRQLWVRPPLKLGLWCPFLTASVLYLDISLAPGWATRGRYTLGRATFTGRRRGIWRGVGTQGAKLVCVEADLRITERATFCQGFCLEDGYLQTCDSPSFC